MSEQLRAPESVKSPEKTLAKRVVPSALWVASGVLAEHAGKKGLADVDATVNSLSQRKTEDLSSHHEKVAAFSTKQRQMHWQEKEVSGANLQSPAEQIMSWQDGVVDFITGLQTRGNMESVATVLETLGVEESDYANNPEEFPSVLRHKVEDFRQNFLNGPADVDGFAEYFTSGRSLEENLEALDNLDGFLGVFGGQETMQLLKDAIVAHAYVDGLAGRKEELLETAREVLGQDLPEETANLYGMLYQQEAGMQPGIEMSLTPPLTENTDAAEPAPLENPEEADGTSLEAGGAKGTGGAAEEVLAGEELGAEMSYAQYQREAVERELSAFPRLHEWFSARQGELSEISSELGNAPVTGEGWGADYLHDESGEVNGVERIGNSSNAFTIEGIDGLPWHQVGVRESTTEVNLKTPEGTTKADISGFVGVVKDAEGNVLVAAYQGPFMNTQKRMVVRTPLQTSAGKFKAMQEGDSGKDKVFVDVLTTIYGQEDPFGKFLAAIEKGDVPAWPFAAVNENRILATNIGMGITVGDELKEALTKDGKYFWATKDEIKALSRSGLLNTVAASAFSAV